MIYGIGYEVPPEIVRQARKEIKKILYDNFLYKTEEFRKVYEVAKRKYGGKVMPFVRTIAYFRKRYPFLRMRLHRKQWLFMWELFVNRREIVIAKGGNKSGKTTAVVYAVICKALQSPRSVIWVVTINYDMNRNIIARKVEELIGDKKKARLVVRNNTLKLFGRTIELKSSQSEDDAFQSASVDLVAFDERPLRSTVFDECYARTIDTRGQVIMAYTPLKEIDFVYDYFIAQNKRFDDERFAIIEMATTENKFVDLEDKIRAISADEDEYQARILGYYRIELDMVRIGENELKQIIRYPSSRMMLVTDASTGRVEEIEIPSNEDPFELFRKREGSFSVFEVFRDYKYANVSDYNNQIVIGVDVAGGVGKDFSVALFYSRVGFLHGALFSNNESVSAFSRHLIHVIRKYYGIYPLLVFERNGLGLALYEIMLSLGFSNFYRPPQSKRLPGVYISNDDKTARVHVLRDMITKSKIDIHYRMAKELADFRIRKNQKPEDFISATLLLTDVLSPPSLFKTDGPAAGASGEVSQETLRAKLESESMRKYSLL